METKELKIQIPKGFEIDKEKSSFEKIVFKKKDTKPRSWEEYCKLMKINNHVGYYINDNSTIKAANWGSMNTPEKWRNILPLEELTEAFLAMQQLMSLRQSWIGDWEPDWSNEYLNKYCITGIRCNFEVYILNKYKYPLSFPTVEMAEDFMNTFKDLLETAKPLI